MTLTEFLLARIAEDLAVATELQSWNADGIASGMDCLTSAEFRHIEHFDAERVLAECEAKRRIIDRYENTTFDDWAEPDREYERWILPLLALPYADHPDYEEPWRP